MVDSFHSCSDKIVQILQLSLCLNLNLATFVTRRFSSERLSHSNLDNTAAQSQICEEPFNNTHNQCDIFQLCQLFWSWSCLLQESPVLYRGWDWSGQGGCNAVLQRYLWPWLYQHRTGAENLHLSQGGVHLTLHTFSTENATFEPNRSVVNFTYVFNSWLLSGRSRTKCFPTEGGGFRVHFSGPMMLHGEYGREGGKLASTNEDIFMDMMMFLMLVSNRDLPSILSHLSHFVGNNFARSIWLSDSFCCGVHWAITVRSHY